MPYFSPIINGKHVTPCFTILQYVVAVNRWVVGSNPSSGAN